MNNLKRKAIETVKFYTDLGNEIFHTDMRTPHVDFSLKGKVGGKYYSKGHKVKVNMVLFAENEEDYIENTIPHEVAHAVQRHLYGAYNYRTGRRVMPHGREWKQIMIAFGKSPSVTHSYDVSNATQRTVPREFVYKCKCRTFNFTIIRHRRVQQAERQGRGSYSCRSCHGKLKYVGRASQVEPAFS